MNISMGLCLECGEVTAQRMCFECFSRFDIIEADEDFNNFVIQRKLEEEE